MPLNEPIYFTESYLVASEWEVQANYIRDRTIGIEKYHFSSCLIKYVHIIVLYILNKPTPQRSFVFPETTVNNSIFECI